MGAKHSTPQQYQQTHIKTKRKRSSTQTSYTTNAQSNATRIPPSTSSNTLLQRQEYDPSLCEQWFQRYCDSDNPNIIGPEGSQQFFQDLDLSIESVMVIALAWKMNMSTMGYITKDEWMSGMHVLRTDSIDKLRGKRSEFESLFRDPKQFKDMYRFTFGYAKNKDQKSMDVEVASVLWTMLLSEQYPLVNHFVSFLQEKKPVRVINRDQWLNFYEFVTTVSDGLQDYDETSAWPVLFDEFVEWKREKQSF